MSFPFTYSLIFIGYLPRSWVPWNPNYLYSVVSSQKECEAATFIHGLAMHEATPHIGWFRSQGWAVTARNRMSKKLHTDVYSITNPHEKCFCISVETKIVEFFTPSLSKKPLLLMVKSSNAEIDGKFDSTMNIIC